MSKLSENKLLQELERGDEFGVKFELARGADANSRDGRGVTALHLASQNGWLSITRALLEAGADANAQDPAGDTPLHYAVWAEHVGVVDVLVKVGADPRIANTAGQRPLDVGSARVRRHLLPHVFDMTGESPTASP